MWECMKCSEQLEDSFDVCWNCGTSRDGTNDPDFRKVDDFPADTEAEEPAAMSECRSEYPDCKGAMQPIKLIDASDPGWDREGVHHIELSYAAPEAARSLFLGKIQRLGVVKGSICADCGRILLYGERNP